MWQFAYIAHHSTPYVVLRLIYVEVEATRRSDDEQSHVLLVLSVGSLGEISLFPRVQSESIGRTLKLF